MARNRNLGPQRAQPPSSIRNAVKLMYGGAAVSAIVIIVALLTIGSAKTAVHNAFPSYSATRVRGAAIGLVAYEVVVQLITIGLWLWMARANQGGRSWARIMSTVLFGLNTLILLASLARPHATLGIVLLLVVWLIGLGAVFFLWRWIQRLLRRVQGPLARGVFRRQRGQQRGQLLPGEVGAGHQAAVHHRIGAERADPHVRHDRCDLPQFPRHLRRETRGLADAAAEHDERRVDDGDDAAQHPRDQPGLLGHHRHRPLVPGGGRGEHPAGRHRAAQAGPAGRPDHGRGGRGCLQRTPAARVTSSAPLPPVIGR